MLKGLYYQIGEFYQFELSEPQLLEALSWSPSIERSWKDVQERKGAGECRFNDSSLKVLKEGAQMTEGKTKSAGGDGSGSASGPVLPWQT
jgi:hypothetical protein